MSKSDRITVKQLSPGVLDMKFMMRTKKRLEAKEKKKKDMELQKSFQAPNVEIKSEETASCSEGMTNISRYEICNDITKLEDLLFGRMSFKGYNKEVEDLMVYYERLKNGELSDEEEDGKDVDDVEMANALAKKFTKKRDRQQEEMRNNEIQSKGGKLNFSDVRKRAAPSGENVGEPERKFMKPAEY